MLLLVTLVYTDMVAQTNPDSISGTKTPFQIENGDTVLIVTLPEINVYPQPVFESKREEKKYWRLIYNLKKVYPYAKIAKAKLNEMNNHFLTLKTDREKKAYTKQVEKEIRAQFEDDLKDLTITQGRLLIKLIDRETGHSSYELVKEFRGNFSAIFWQALARIFGSSLKTKYDATGEDLPIENILVAIDAGYL